jgi:hypothetical protein
VNPPFLAIRDEIRNNSHAKLFSCEIKGPGKEMEVSVTSIASCGGLVRAVPALEFINPPLETFGPEIFIQRASESELASRTSKGGVVPRALAG